MQRRTKFEINAWLTLLFLLGILLVGGILLKNHNQRLDVTQDQRFTLAPQTKKVVKSLSSEVKILAFYGKPMSDQKARDLLNQYAYESPKLKVRFVDPNREPQLAKSYGVNLNGTIILESGAKQEKVTACDEENLTSALIKVISKEVKSLYFVKGHGEKEIGDHGPQGLFKLKSLLEKEGYGVKELSLMNQAIPREAKIVVLAGPVKSYLASELLALKSFVDGGGKLFGLFDPETPDDVARFISQYGFTLNKDVVVSMTFDLLNGKLNYDFNVSVNNYKNHEITKDFRVASYFPFCTSIKTQSGKFSLTELAMVNGISLPREEVLGKKQVKLDVRKGKKGMLCIAAIGSFKAGDKENRLAVFGDSDFISNSYISVLGNEDLFMNTLSWLAQEEQLISIRPKESLPTPLMLSPAQTMSIFLIAVVGLPLFVLLIGLTLWIRKKARR